MRALFWIGLAAAALATVWFLLSISPPSPPPPPPNEIRLEAHGPWVIGDHEDAFAYAGEGVRTIDGTANLRIDLDTVGGLLQFELLPDKALSAVLGGANANHSVTLRMQLEQADELWIDHAVDGDSGIGESRLPGTYALYAGSGRFELLADGRQLPSSWQGFWSVGHALRQPDGAIRDQGLVFSPLLRNRSRFSDSSRLEFTLLIYASQESRDVVLHLVFPDVQPLDAGTP